MFERNRLSTALLCAFGGTFSLFTTTVMSQEQLNRVEITGSSIKRIDAETALPVTIIRRADIERTGATTAQDLVNLIPSNFGGQTLAQNVGATGVASTANLRGLGQKYTLVLLNGRRVANYAFGNSPVDLNSIPLSAIERIEVLRDGASAVYGADAVAGVINFILRKDYQGLEATLGGTRGKHPGGNIDNFNVTGGYGDLDKQGFNFLLSLNHEEDKAVRAKDRSYAQTANRPDLGINKASPRNGVPNFNFKDTLNNTYTGVNPYRYNGCNNPEFALVVTSNKQCGTDYVQYIDLIPEAKHDNAVAHLTIKLSENHELYAEGAYTKDTSKATYSPAPYTVNMTYPANGRFYPKSFIVPKGYVVPTGTTYNLANGTTIAGGQALPNDVTVTPTGPMSGTWRTVAGGGRTDLTEVTNGRYVVGAKGTALNWDYDTALTFSKNTGVISFGPGQFSYAKLTPLVNAGSINVFGSQDAASQAALDSALLTGPEQSAISKSTEADFKMSREIFNLPAGPVGFAIGGSIRRESLDQISYPVLASGDQVGGAGPIPSVSGDRRVYGVFTEASVPLYKGLDLDLAGRYDYYKNGFGTKFHNLSPKAALRFQPMKDVLLRASYGKGFRAPTLYENLRPFTSGNNTNGNFNDPIRCPNGTPITNTINTVGALQDECAVQQPTALEGNKNVKPEKSTQYSLGLVLTPVANLSISVDYFDVSIKDAIQQQSEIQVFNAPTAYQNSFYRYDPSNPAFAAGYVDAGGGAGAIRGSTNKDFPLAYVYLPYDNQGKFFASGFDFSAAYRIKLPVGQFGVNYDATYFTKHGFQSPGLASVSDNGVYKDYGVQPRYRHALTVTLAQGDWNGSLTHNYTRGYGDYVNADLIGANYPAEARVAAAQTIDGQVGWKGIKNLTLVLGVKNILDRDPPTSRNDQFFQVGYDAQYASPVGRAYYFRANYRFF